VVRRPEVAPTVTPVVPLVPPAYGEPALLAGESDEASDAAWYDGLAFEGPLDPAGTLFAFLLAVLATVALVVIVAGVVRVLGAA
jgi:hypothetical protein